MKLGRVVGNVVSTIKSPVFDGRPLLICDLLDENLRPSGGYLIAVDTVGAGPAPIAMHLKDIAQVYFADLGTRIFYTQHASFDTHAGEMAAHPALWKDMSEGIAAFFEDLKEHDAGDNVVMYLFSEFGRRVHDNGVRGILAARKAGSRS